MKKLIVGTFVAVSGILAGAGVAGASHVHSLETGSGSCVLLAQDGGEKEVQLPFATGAENRLHPLHVLVHLGERSPLTIGVAGNLASDPCAPEFNYVNSH